MASCIPSSSCCILPRRFFSCRWLLCVLRVTANGCVVVLRLTTGVPVSGGCRFCPDDGGFREGTSGSLFFRIILLYAKEGTDKAAPHAAGVRGCLLLLERFNFEKVKTRGGGDSAARPEVSGENALFPRNDRPYGWKCTVFQAENTREYFRFLLLKICLPEKARRKKR